jgi:hypothetical protein
MLALREKRELERLRAQDQLEIKRLQKQLSKDEKSLAEVSVLLLTTKSTLAVWVEAKENRPLRRIAGGRWRSLMALWRPGP